MKPLKKKILHVSTDLKFITPFIEIINKNYNINQHTFIVITKENEITPHDHVIFINKKSQLLKILFNLNKNNKIILHGLFSNVLLIILFFQPWLMKKCYWVMWGGDFYLPESQSWFKKQVIKRIRHFVTFLKGDFELVKKWYGAKGMLHECFMYPSNLYKEYDVKPKENGGIINIQVGNSANPTNNHIEVFEKLRQYKDENIKICVPLSYGPQDHVKDVIAKGKEIFGDKFIALTDFMSFEKYLDFLGAIDIAIFAHKRQQAMGNTISLLGMGKKVYIRNDITTWQLLKDIGVKVFDFNDIYLDLMESKTRDKNIKIIKSYFSKENYLNQLKKIF